MNLKCALETCLSLACILLQDAADILQSYVKLNVTGEQCRRRWLELTARHTAIGKPGTKPSFAKSLSILEKTFGIEKMEEGDKAEVSSEEGKEGICVHL